MKILKNFIEISRRTTNDMKQEGKKSVMLFFRKVSKKSYFTDLSWSKPQKKCNYAQVLGLKPTQTQNQTNPYLGRPLDQRTHLLNNMQQTNI